jgi:redox-sensitive bicupin YhaK (pirin superfamily)
MSRALVRNAISRVEPLAKGSNMLSTLDPFIFAVYHVGNYPAGDSHMRAPRHGDGADFDHSADYRMYHGDDIPGFPQHPHRGFETLTATVTGIIDHADSVGNAGRYGQGDLQWMTAGRGVVHGEIFPLANEDKPNPLKLFQIWLNLPRKSKMVDPDFVMVSSYFFFVFSSLKPSSLTFFFLALG